MVCAKHPPSLLDDVCEGIRNRISECPGDAAEGPDMGAALVPVPSDPAGRVGPTMSARSEARPGDPATLSRFDSPGSGEFFDHRQAVTLGA
jgi:hypothetical protein